MDDIEESTTSTQEPNPTSDLESIAAVPDKISEVGALVDTWHLDMFPGSVVARQTEVWNHVMQAKDELKKRLEKFLS